MTKITETQTSEAELDTRNETVVLLVLARERPSVARALLAAAAEAGADPTLVRTTSDGFAVPRHLAELADLVLAEDVAPPIEGRPRVYAAATANDADQTHPPAAEAETAPKLDDNATPGRRRGGKGADK